MCWLRGSCSLLRKEADLMRFTMPLTPGETSRARNSTNVAPRPTTAMPEKKSFLRFEGTARRKEDVKKIKEQRDKLERNPHTERRRKGMNAA